MKIINGTKLKTMYLNRIYSMKMHLDEYLERTLGSKDLGILQNQKSFSVKYNCFMYKLRNLLKTIICHSWVADLC